MCKRRGRKGFTLIELLVVMAIIMLLAGASMPVYHRFRASGYQIKCLANLKAIGSAMNAYQTHHSGWMPYILEETGLQAKGVAYRHADKAVGWKYEISAVITNIDDDTHAGKRFTLSEAFFDPVKGKGKSNYFISKKQFGAKIQTLVYNVETQKEEWEDYYDYTNLVQWQLQGVHGRVVQKEKPKGYMPYSTWKEPANAAIVAPSKAPDLQRGLGRKNNENMDDDNINIEYRHLGSANVLFLDSHVKVFNKGDEEFFKRFDIKDMMKAERIQQLDDK